MTIQLIGKDDSSFDDSEVLTGRWQAYIDSYVSVRIYAPSIDQQLLIFIIIFVQGENTESVTQNRVRRPYLRR